MVYCCKINNQHMLEGMCLNDAHIIKNRALQCKYRLRHYNLWKALQCGDRLKHNNLRIKHTNVNTD